jgi:hypothetical protein
LMYCVEQGGLGGLKDVQGFVNDAEVTPLPAQLGIIQVKVHRGKITQPRRGSASPLKVDFPVRCGDFRTTVGTEVCRWAIGHCQVYSASAKIKLTHREAATLYRVSPPCLRRSLLSMLPIHPPHVLDQSPIRVLLSSAKRRVTSPDTTDHPEL